MISHPPIRVLVPTWNNVDEIDATVQSVLEQDTNPEKIHLAFVDFGSTDGTMEKLRALPSQRTGIFSISGATRGRTMVAQAVRMLELQSVPGRLVLLWPGDILYPDYVSSAELWLNTIWKQQLNIVSLVQEVDIKKEDGSVERQVPLFSSPCVLRAFSSDSTEYLQHGYRHQVMLYNFPFSKATDKVGTYANHLVHWNQLSHAGLYKSFAYTPHPVACVREFTPPDELDDLLFRFEVGLTSFRMGHENSTSHVLGSHYEQCFRQSLAKYSLWRAWLLHAHGRAKIAEDCFILARVIDPSMDENEAWLCMERYLDSGGTEDRTWLEAWFAALEAPRAPKWCLGGIVRRWQRQWKEWRTNDHPSVFGE